MSSIRLHSAVGFVLLAGCGLTAGAQMPSMPQIPQPPPIAAPPPMAAPSAPPDQMPPPDMSQGPQGNQGDQGNQGYPRNGGQGGAGFMGAWCAQGDPAKQASISNNGVFLNLTNENGDTSIGNLQGSNQITAPGWQFVNGTLSADGRRINWSNGTFWSRCYNGGGGGYGHINLNGNWYPNGDRSLNASIQQRHNSLTLQNESGQRATGSFNGRNQVTTNWGGTRVTGTVSRDGNRIDWSNGTYWMRYRLYSPQ